MTSKKPTSGEETMRAARAFSRRLMLRASAAGAAMAASPALVREGLTQTKTLNILVWDDDGRQPV